MNTRFCRYLVCGSVVATLLCAAARAQIPGSIESLRAQIAAQERAQGPDNLDVAQSLSGLASLLFDAGQYAEAEPLFRRCLKIREQLLGPDDPLVAQSLNDLGVLYRTMGRLAAAELLYQRSLAIREKTLGADHVDTATALHNLGRLYHDLGRFAEAEALYARSLAIRERALGPEHPAVALSLHDIGTLYWERGRFAEAEPVYNRSLAIREKSLPPDDPELARSLNNLALLYWNQGRYAEAEPMYQRSLAIREQRLGPGHRDVAISLNNLALLFYFQGRYTEAEAFYRRCVAIAEKTLGTQHTLFAQCTANLARVYADQGRYEEAEPLYARSLAIREQVLGPEHPDLAVNLNALGLLFQGLKRYTDAEPMFQRSLAIRERAFGPEHPYVAQSLNNLAQLYQLSGRYALAEPLYARALAVREQLLGRSHPDVANTLHNLASLYTAESRTDLAYGYSHRAFELLKSRFSEGADHGGGRLTEQRNKRNYFTSHVALLARPEFAANRARSGESFEAAQLAQASSVGQSVAQMAARFAAQGGELASAIRRRQDTADKIARADKALIHATGQATERIDRAYVARMRDEIIALEKTLRDETAAISARFPEYDALVSQAPVAAGSAQKLVRDNEALLVYLVDEAGCFAWVVRTDRVQFYRLDVSADELTRRVNRLRRRLDPEQNSRLDPFDTAAAHALYQKIFGPLENSLKDATHLILVTDGPLQSLPFSVLVDRTAGARGKPQWLIDRFAFSVVPSVSALRALRTFSRAGTGARPFIGFGDPVLEGRGGQTERIAARAIYAAAATRSREGESGLADVDAIRQATALPETAKELKALAHATGATNASLRLGADATETLAKRMDLSQYRVLAFATHGVMAGEITGIAEPGLVLTPPARASSLDDGYLSASEVAQLKLNADWVILSACNTAAPDGSPGAEGLSGLARGFFYAGARSLLVSNWYVESDSALLITTEMFRRYAASPRAGKGEALRQAMLKLKNDPRYGEPLFWAPFMIVGEGGGTVPPVSRGRR